MQIRLNPNSVCYDRGEVKIRTLLGSCVAITFWHPRTHHGFMSHFSEPSSSRLLAKREARLDPRYGDDSIELFLRMAAITQTDPRDFVVKVFGGGNMFYDKTLGSPRQVRPKVGEQNVEAAFRCLRAQDLEITVADVGEFGYRDIIFDLTDGSVLVKLSGKSIKAKRVIQTLGAEFKT